MGVLAGLSRMNSDSEMIALKTMGIRNNRIFKPVFIFSLVAYLVSAFLMMYVTPEAQYQLRKLWNKVAISNSIINIKPQIICDRFNDYILYFESTDAHSNTWQNVILYPHDTGQKENILLARKGRMVQSQDGDYFFSLKDGTIHSFNRLDKRDRSYAIGEFKSKTEEIQERSNYKFTRTSRHLPFHQLLQKNREKPHQLSIRTELHRQLTQPLSALVLGFLGLSLGISIKKGGKASGFVISLGVIFLYYILITAAENMIIRRLVTPFWGMWGPIFILFAIAFISYYLTSREITFSRGGIRQLFKVNFFSKLQLFFTSLATKRINTSRQRNMIKILDRYILKKIVFLFILMILSLTAIFYMLNVIDLIDDAISNDVSILVVLQHVLYRIPRNLGFVMPIAAMTSVLLTFSIMSKNNEITAIRASGISIYRLVIPALLMGLLLSGGFFLFQETIVPRSSETANQLLNTIKNRHYFHLKTNKKGLKAGQNKFYFYRQYNVRTREFQRFNLIYLDGDFRIKERIFATSAQWQGSKEIRLTDGFVKTFEQNTPVTSRTFDRELLPVSESRSAFEKESFPDFMNIRQTRDYIRFLKENHSDAAKYQAKLYQRMAFPFSTLVMILIAIPFSFRMGKRGTLFGIGIAIGISMAFWGISTFSNSLGQASILSPLVSAFLPLGLFIALSVTLLFLHNR
jgi:LPS export ABC transporter permease LptG/LPS export ABC transporter permease LptF